LAALFGPRADKYWLNASNVDEVNYLIAISLATFGWIWLLANIVERLF